MVVLATPAVLWDPVYGLPPDVVRLRGGFAGGAVVVWWVVPRGAHIRPSTFTHLPRDTTVLFEVCNYRSLGRMSLSLGSTGLPSESRYTKPP